MAVRVEQLKCPNCGAPLGAPSERGFSVCIYCTATSRISKEGIELAAETERTISAAQMERVRALLLSGQRSQAVALYVELSGSDAREAEEVVTSMSGRLAFGVLASRPLNTGGVIFMLLVIPLLAGNAGLALTGYLPRAALIGTVVVALLLYPFFIGFFVTLRYLGARSAPATVVHSVDVGPMGTRGRIFKLLIEIHPPNEAAFRAEVVVPVRLTRLENMRPGANVRARYFPGDTTRVLCERAPGA